jgi:hypothetical protein
MRKFVFATSFAIISFITIGIAYGESLPCDDANNCCFLDACENPKAELVVGFKWDGPGSFENITFKINEGSDPTLPSLITDVNVAASKWTNIQFYGKTVKVGIYYEGTHNNPANWPGRQDSLNIVGWTQTYNKPAETRLFPDLNNPWKIIEADISLDYYEPFAEHAPQGQFPADKFCVRNTVAHEFGHFIGLSHILKADAQSNVRPTCHIQCMRLGRLR